MDRKSPRADTLKVLYALSGNQCAFTGCEHPIFNDDNLYIANLCHIEAVAENGPRYNSSQTEDERRGIDNLLFMCHRHHKETDDISKFDVDALRRIKNTHQAQFSESGRSATTEMLNQVIAEINTFWTRLNSKKFDHEHLKIERDFDQNIVILFDELNRRVVDLSHYCDLIAHSESSEVLLQDVNVLFEKLGLDSEMLKKIDYYENPLMNRNWELHNLGRPNYFSHLNLCIFQLKVKVFETVLKLQPDNNEIKAELDLSKRRFEDLYNESYYVD